MQNQMKKKMADKEMQTGVRAPGLLVRISSSMCGAELRVVVSGYKDYGLGLRALGTGFRGRVSSLGHRIYGLFLAVCKPSCTKELGV